MAKRSPILGYNHNVRYRGLVFHVQTEDSGVLSPHLFTHLFHAGVIVSTRKLVYDSGSAEDSIKSLMQAQHKAVLKDLRRGHFDDKIDQYLGGTPGLLPRENGAGATSAADSSQSLARPSAPEIEIIQGADEPVDSKIATDPQQPAIAAQLAQASAQRPSIRRDATIPDVRPPPPPPPRTSTANRTPVPSSLDEVGAVDVAISAANNATIRTPIPREFLDQAPRAETEAPEIEIQLELDEPDDAPLQRRHRDTTHDAVPPLDEHTRPTMDVSQISDGVPGMVHPAATIRQDSVPISAKSGRVSVGAASLPPARPINRPPTRPAIPVIQAPQVVARPLPADERGRSPSDAVEVYAPAPPSVEPPPGAVSERPGQYSQHKRQSEKIPLIQSSQNATVPAGLGRPGRGQSGPIPKPVTREPTPAGAVPTAVRPEQTPGSGRARTPTPARTARSGGNANSGVVMTRPAVIVGAPAKPAAPARVRKAREDEGRGFGQGLISEKSLDEVILAYLSEDADEK
ncbi:MAG TPA: hypothetical protein VFQ53_10365 [Kofleriaceae bacterium]|nr:hypothetical protein [Kofleriaceae bacterium]